MHQKHSKALVRLRCGQTNGPATLRMSSRDLNLEEHHGAQAGAVMTRQCVSCSTHWRTPVAERVHIERTTYQGAADVLAYQSCAPDYGKEPRPWRFACSDGVNPMHFLAVCVEAVNRAQAPRSILQSQK